MNLPKLPATTAVMKKVGYVKIAGERFKYVQDNHKARRKRNRYYDQEVLIALKKIWKEADYICSKQLAPFLAEFIPVLEGMEK